MRWRCVRIGRKEALLGGTLGIISTRGKKKNSLPQSLKELEPEGTGVGGIGLTQGDCAKNDPTGLHGTGDEQARGELLLCLRGLVLTVG